MDERTAEILKRFEASWEDIKKFYDDLLADPKGWERYTPVREFINDLEEKRGKLYYRLGVSLARLMISRSADNGLRADQKFIMIVARETGGFEVTFQDREKIYRQYQVNDLQDPRVTKLLETLKSVLVD